MEYGGEETRQIFNIDPRRGKRAVGYGINHAPNSTNGVYGRK